jgi:hypothetical protein
MATEALVEEDARGIGVEKTPTRAEGRSPVTERPQSEILRGFFLRDTLGARSGALAGRLLYRGQRSRHVLEGLPLGPHTD